MTLFVIETHTDSTILAPKKGAENLLCEATHVKIGRRESLKTVT